jgi:septal ring factor EnvC (AmiA/AmiB activator)
MAMSEKNVEHDLQTLAAECNKLEQRLDELAKKLAAEHGERKQEEELLDKELGALWRAVGLQRDRYYAR